MDHASCAAAANVDAKVEKLGDFYNELEDALYNLECAGQKKAETYETFESKLEMHQSTLAEVTQRLQMLEAVQSTLSSSLSTH